MKSLLNHQSGGLAALLVILLVATRVCGQTATHSVIPLGYSSPGTITVTNTFYYPAGATLTELYIYPLVPDDWTVSNVRGQGYPELGWDGGILFTQMPSLPPSPITMLYDVTIPPGETGAKQIVDWVGYNLGAGLMELMASPNPLVIEKLDKKTLQIISPYGTGTPPVGIHTNQAGTVLNVSMEDTWSSGPTQYVCKGWSMAGNEPVSGTSSSFTMTITNNAVLTWNWEKAKRYITVPEGGTNRVEETVAYTNGMLFVRLYNGFGDRGFVTYRYTGDPTFEFNTANLDPGTYEYEVFYTGSAVPVGYKPAAVAAGGHQAVAVFEGVVRVTIEPVSGLYYTIFTGSHPGMLLASSESVLATPSDEMNLFMQLSLEAPGEAHNVKLVKIYASDEPFAASDPEPGPE